MAITLAAICDAITVVIEAIPIGPRVSSYDELLEGVNQADYAEVYWEETGMIDSKSGRGQTSKGTFGSDGLIQEVHTFHVDYYCRPRSQLEEDIKAVVETADEIITVLEAESCAPFNLEGIRSFQWSLQRMTWIRGAGVDAVRYSGLRVIIKVWTF